jgi:prepilin-type N-terminal cleavage/methylation domain-containing protein
MMKRDGFTLAEMLISLIVAAVLILTIGAISSISLTVNKKLRTEASIYTDLSYGLKLMRNRARGAKSLKCQLVGTPWVSDQLIFNNQGAFGIYKEAGSTTRDFVYLADKDDPTNREVILAIPDPEFNLVLKLDDDRVCVPDKTYKNVTVTLDGTKDKIDFVLENTIMRRN